MTTKDSRYPSPFADHKAVGIVWSDKVEYSTWFGGNTEFIHCIQMLPFLPISEELLREEWIRCVYKILKIVLYFSCSHFISDIICREEYEVLKEVYDRPDPPLSEEWKVSFEIAIFKMINICHRAMLSWHMRLLTLRQHMRRLSSSRGNNSMHSPSEVL